MSVAKMSRDWKDTNTVYEFLDERNPFDHGEALCSITNGVHAQATVNIDGARHIGNQILENMARVSLRILI